MSNRTLLMLTGIVLVGIFILLAINIMPYISNIKSERYLTYNGVRGMAIEHNNLLYTLNFEQQNELIGILNMALPIGSKAYTQDNEKPNFEKIIIYRFNSPDAVITPIAYQGNELVFSIPEWNNNGLMKEVSRGELKSLLEKTYDP